MNYDGIKTCGRIGIVAALLLMGGRALGGDDFFTNWPTNCDPAVVGKRVAVNLVNRPEHMRYKNGGIHYAEAAAAVGALRVAALTGDKGLQQQLVARFEAILTPGSPLVSTNRHVDHSVFGIVPLEIYMRTGDQRYLDLGQRLADRQWENPLADGLTAETRWWIDDMYMIGSLQIQAYRATKDAKYADRVALELSAYLDKLQQPNGLFFHGPEFHHFWGRGNGWVAAALAEVLSALPENHPRRARLMEGYLKMMNGLRPYQAQEGLWRQLIDNDQSWLETSCTAMFSYAMITGVQRGWLEAKVYGEVARKGWIGMCGYLDDEANLREICVGTGQKKEVSYYLERPRKTGDFHGQAPVLWCAAALLEAAPAAARERGVTTEVKP